MLLFFKHDLACCFETNCGGGSIGMTLGSDEQSIFIVYSMSKAVCGTKLTRILDPKAEVLNDGREAFKMLPLASTGKGKL